MLIERPYVTPKQTAEIEALRAENERHKRRWVDLKEWAEGAAHYCSQCQDNFCVVSYDELVKALEERDQ